MVDENKVEGITEVLGNCAGSPERIRAVLAAVPGNHPMVELANESPTYDTRE